MTTRERKQRRAERLREWAEKRRKAAGETLAATEHYRGDHAFNTQPGHIPERARVIRREDAAFSSLRKADRMESRADGIESQLDRSIYSDDDNALEALKARIAEREATRARMRSENAYWRKHGTMKGCPGWSDERAARMDAEIPTRYEWERKGPHRPYELQNLGGRITADRKRLELVEMQAGRRAAADAGGGVAIDGGDYVAITFAEKPGRDVLDALRGAGFRWSLGSWCGPRVAIPAAVLEAARYHPNGEPVGIESTQDEAPE